MAFSHSQGQWVTSRLWPAMKDIQTEAAFQDWCMPTWMMRVGMGCATTIMSFLAMVLRFILTLYLERQRIRMFSARRSLLAAAASVPLLTLAIDEAGSQTANSSRQETPAEMAKAIAHAIDTNVPKTPNAPIVFESATSRDNVVEVHYAAKDARFFQDAEKDRRRLGQAGYFCFNHRISLFRKHGIVIRHILTAPDNRAPFEFSVDQSTCAALMADAKLRAETAEQKRVNSTQSAAESHSLAEPKPVRTMKIRPEQVEQK